MRTNFVGTKALRWRPAVSLHGEGIRSALSASQASGAAVDSSRASKSWTRSRRRSREFWNAGSALGNLGAAICVRNTDAGPATGEVHPDLDASAILSRAASIKLRK